MQARAFLLMLDRRSCLPARHAMQFTFLVNRTHRMYPLNNIACMHFQESKPDILLKTGKIILK